MRHTAKLFMNGRSQAVSLPAAFRFDCREVFIRRILFRAISCFRVSLDPGMTFSNWQMPMR